VALAGCNILAGITGSASGAMSVALQTLADPLAGAGDGRAAGQSFGSF